MRNCGSTSTVLAFGNTTKTVALVVVTENAVLVWCNAARSFRLDVNLGLREIRGEDSVSLIPLTIVNQTKQVY